MDKPFCSEILIDSSIYDTFPADTKWEAGGKAIQCFTDLGVQKAIIRVFYHDMQIDRFEISKD